jgi:hypothetical protein
MTTMSPARSRLVAVGILLLLIATAIAAIAVPAVMLHRRYDTLIADMLDRLQRYRRVAAQQPQWQRVLDELRARDSTRFTLKNQASNLAGAELQDMVRGAIESAGGKIITIQSAQPKEEGRFRQVGLNVQMFAPTAGVQKILYALETQAPYVFIDNLSIRATAFRGYRPNPGVEPELNVQMDVSSFSSLPPAKK